MPAGEDFYVPKKNKESVGDVTAVEGDAHLDEIADFMHFFNKGLAGLGPPKHHLGYEQDTMRSVGTELTMVFARKARWMSSNFIAGLQHLYWIELLLAGRDPRKTKYVIFPPSLGTRDELIRAQIQQAHSTTCKQLADAFSKTGKMPDHAWFLRFIMNMDDEAIAAADLVDVIAKGGKQQKPNGPKIGKNELDAMLATVLQSEEAAAELRYLRFLLEDRTIAKMTAEQAYKLGLYAGDAAAAFDVENCCKQLLITERLQ